MVEKCSVWYRKIKLFKTHQCLILFVSIVNVINIQNIIYFLNTLNFTSKLYDINYFGRINHSQYSIKIININKGQFYLFEYLILFN